MLYVFFKHPVCYLILLLNMFLGLLAVGTKDLLDRPVPQVIDELKDGDQVISIGVALPVTFSLHQGFLRTTV